MFNRNRSSSLFFKYKKKYTNFINIQGDEHFNPKDLNKIIYIRKIIQIKFIGYCKIIDQKDFLNSYYQK